MIIPTSRCRYSHRDDGVFNLRARAVSEALQRKLLNHGALERAEADMQSWLAGR